MADVTYVKYALLIMLVVIGNHAWLRTYVVDCDKRASRTWQDERALRISCQTQMRQGRPPSSRRVVDAMPAITKDFLPGQDKLPWCPRPTGDGVR